MTRTVPISIPRRWRARVLPGALLTLALLAAACGSADGADDTAGASDGRIAVLRVGAPGQATDNLNPLLTNGIADYTAVFHLYDTLVRLTSDGTEMALATSIEPDDDADEWTIRIRDDATFHDGSPVTADDVIASLTLMADPEQSPNYAAFFSDIDVDGLRTVDGHTAVVPLHRARGDFVDTVLTFASFVFPAEVDDWTEAVGSGPYRLESYAPGESTVLVAHEDHWEGRPRVERIEITTVDDAATRLGGVRSGQFDLGLRVDPAGVTGADPTEVEVVASGTAGSQGMALVMNTAVAPFDDLEVRRAVRLVVDREQLVDSVLLGYGSEGNDLIGAGLPGYADGPRIERDVEEARRILAEKGVTEATLVVADIAPGTVAAGELLIDQFADADVELRLDRREPATYFADFEEFLARPFQALYYVNRPAPAFLGNFTGSTSFFNPSGYADPGYEALLAEAQAEVDPDARAELFARAQATFQEEGGVVVWGFQDQLDAVRPGLDGMRVVQSIPLLSEVHER